MPDGSLPLSAFLPPADRRFYDVEPAGVWWRVLSTEGEVARYRTRAAALDGARAVAAAMRALGVQVDVLVEGTAEPAARGL